jgi:hypothetical protein
MNQDQITRLQVNNKQKILTNITMTPESSWLKEKVNKRRKRKNNQKIIKKRVSKKHNLYPINKNKIIKSQLSSFLLLVICKDLKTLVLKMKKSINGHMNHK